METKQQKCASCYGEGVIGSEYGLEDCPDCAGQGQLPSGTVLTERRLRDLERSYLRRNDGTAHDVDWLVSSLRHSHDVLLKILTASQDADESDASARQIRHLANEVLGVYPTHSA